MNQREKADFTQGSILNKLIPFMMPVLGALVLQAAYGAVDLLVVGRFGRTFGRCQEVIPILLSTDKDFFVRKPC